MVALAALTLGTFLPARDPIATRCAPGTFDPRLTRVENTPLADVSSASGAFAGDASTSGAFVIGGDSITLGVCGTAELHVRVRPRRTFYRARWPVCGRFGSVRYRGTSLYGPCDVVGSTLRFRDPRTGRRRTLVFNSTRSGE
jgi:hypothetical protein